MEGIIMGTARETIPKGHRAAPTELSVAARGATTRGSAGQRIVTTTRLTIGATTSERVSSGLKINFWFFTFLPFM